MLTTAARGWLTTAAFLAAIILGSLFGALAPAAAEQVSGVGDPLILVLVAALFFTLRFEGFSALRRAPRTVLLTLGVNFLAIPFIAFALTALLPNDALRLGVLIYLLAPCTDWFLGFTRLAGGDTTIGAALIPVQLGIQLMLYPVWLSLFAGEQVATTVSALSMLLTWFVLPAAIGVGLRVLVRFVFAARWRRRLVDAVDRVVPAIIAAVIFVIFAGNVGTILTNPESFAWVLLVVLLFFVVTYVLGEAVARLFRLRHSEYALLTVSSSARNAPLMLAMTTIALPDQHVVHAAIILGMLIEFPHLTAITQLLRRRQSKTGPVSEYVTAS